MRGFFGLSSFFPPRRNQPVRLENPHPVPEYGTSDAYSGNEFEDGYVRLSKADPDRAGNPPPVKGNEGPVPQGPDSSFEQ